MLTYLNSLKTILTENEKNENQLFVCIEDLVSNGLILSRFHGNESTPGRQDVTQFIAAWFKRIGIPEETCREWLLIYSIDVLSEISSSSVSRIRHSTKSNVKYIYGSDVSFDCGCEHNPFKAPCRESCPVYAEMLEKYHLSIKKRLEEKERLEEIARETAEAIKNQPKKVEKIGKKEEYKEQFNKAMELALDLRSRGYRKTQILEQLNKEGFKTKLGMKWAYNILLNELKAIDRKKENYQNQAFEKA
ncbi:MAG: hypothetical protein GY950_35640 [bacterium]|nr:hypothetical protein [bacterium]